MKRPYVAPELESFGSIQKVTGVLEGGPRVDYVYNSAGEPISGENDHGSIDICYDVQSVDNCVVVQDPR